MYDIVEKAVPRILVIDDNESIHADFRAILAPRPGQEVDLAEEKAALFGDNASAASNTISFEVDSALQGQEGVDKICQALRENRPYAMAFVDIRMPPGMDGIETVKAIWRRCPNIEIVICSAYSDYSWQDMIRELGQTDKLLILKKPFDNIEVQQLAASLTLKWQLMNRLDQMVKQRTQEIYQWLRQLECLNRISTLLEPLDIQWDLILPTLVDLIPSALRYPDLAGAKLTVDGQEFHGGHGHGTTWKHQEKVCIGDASVGLLQVGYGPTDNGVYDTSFSRDEIELIGKISQKVGCALERHQMWRKLKEEDQDLEPVTSIDC